MNTHFRSMETLIAVLWLGLALPACAFEWVGEGFDWLVAGKTNLAKRVVEPEAAWEALKEQGETLELPDQLFEAGKAYASLYRKSSVQQQIDALSQRLAKGQGDRINLLVQMGNLQIRNRQFNAAAHTFLVAIREFPTVQTPVERLAFCLLSLGDHRGGHRLYEQLAKSEHPGAGITMNYGAACYNVGNPEAAAEQFTKYMALRAIDWKGAYNLGAALFAMADFEGAEERFRQAHDLAPSRPYGLLGQVWVKEMLQDEKNYGALKRELERRLGPEDTAQLLARPRLPAFLVNTPVFPLKALERPLAAEVRQVWLNHLMARLSRAKHDLSRERLLRECLQLEPDHADCLDALYQVYVTRREPIMGGMVIRAGLRSGQKPAYWKDEWESLLRLYQKQVELSDAAEVSEEDRERAKRHFALAVEQARAGQYREAEIELRKILVRFPRWPKGLLELSQLYVVWNKPQLALNLCEAAAVLHPEMGDFTISLGGLLFAAGYPEQGIRHLEALRESNPQHAGILARLLNLYTDAGRPDRVCAESDVFARNFPDSQQVLTEVYRACLQAGDAASADRMAARLRLAFPDSEAVAKLLSDAPSAGL